MASHRLRGGACATPFTIEMRCAKRRSAGGESLRAASGLAVVGGLLFSQLITLYITPVYYTYLDSFQQKVRQLFQKRRDRVLPAASAGD